MKLLRSSVLTACMGIVALWCVAWLPPEVLPQSLLGFLYVFGGALTFLLVPALLGISWFAADWYRTGRGHAWPEDPSRAP